MYPIRAGGTSASATRSSRPRPGHTKPFARRSPQTQISRFCTGIGFFPVSDVSQPDPRLSALDAFAGWPQLAVFLAVVALLIAAAFQPWWRRAIALIGWGIFLLDVGCLFLITAVYPTY